MRPECPNLTFKDYIPQSRQTGRELTHTTVRDKEETEDAVPITVLSHYTCDFNPYRRSPKSKLLISHRTVEKTKTKGN